MWTELLERVLDEPGDDGRPRRLDARWRQYGDELLRVASDSAQDHDATRAGWDRRCRELMAEIAAWAGIEPPPEDFYVTKFLRDR